MTLPDGALPTNGYGGPSLPQSQSHPGLGLDSDCPSAYLQLSDLRTGAGLKRKRASSDTESSSLSTPLSLRLPTDNDHDHDHEAKIRVAPAGFEQCIFDTPQDLCVDCVVDCDDADCLASPDEKCTDQCIVVPCDDQNTCHNVNVCTEEPCRVENCDGGNPCLGILDDSLQLLCCTDYHDCNSASSQIDWNCTLDALLGINACNYGGFPECSHPSVPNPQIPNGISNPGMSDTHFGSPNFAALSHDNGISESSGSLVATPTEAQVQTAVSLQSVPQQAPNPNDFVCRWLGCNLSFNSLNELVGHVNLTHLRPPSPSSHPAKKLRLSNSNSNSNPDADADSGNKVIEDSNATTEFPLPLACHWDDCHLYPDASTLPGPSTGLQPEMAFDLLSSHFFHDHLGLAVPPSQLHIPTAFHNTGISSSSESVENGELKLNTKTNDLDGQVEPMKLCLTLPGDPSNETNQADIKPSYATPEPSPPPSANSVLISNTTATSTPHDCSTTPHICHWVSCGLSFPTCAALTEHLALAHVGSGKGHYDCYWGDCARSGKQGFASKQKIMRHLQAHTGYRPFVCKECGQHFSEAATLAQHMRRHTQEKPFVCDFPGCGKAFAITGALTIHKRTHNGERPFQCPHCDRAFAESSNLSKHLRTHTGDRPYRCNVPGCGKAFARPDQLQRHGNVHTKKTNASTAGGSSTNSRTGTEIPTTDAAADGVSGEVGVVKS